MSGKSPLVKLNNGVEMPALGLGVYAIPGEDTPGAVRSAIAEGYRLIDTAAVYGNERQVGEGIRQSEIDRAEMFLTTKLWISDFGYEPALRAFDASLRRLGMDYVDLYLLHWPVPKAFDATVAAYKAAGKLLAEGRVRAIGVSNFSEQHLDVLMTQTDTVPAVNQIELHPFFSQRELREVDARLGIVTQSWSPIGGILDRHPVEGLPVRNPLEHPLILQLAARHGKTPAQVVLRWHMQHGLSAVPKSVHAARIRENIDIFDFQLGAEELAAVDALDTGLRGGPDPEMVDTELAPIRIEE